MDPERWARLEREFHELSEAEADRRLARLAELDEEDPQLAEELRGMLGGPGDDSVERSLEQLGQVASEIGLAALGPGSRVEGFELGEPIGEGGMGQVFEATQLQPRRRVALKVMRFGLDSSQLATMFEAEAETLARLGHPAIAHVYAAGLMRRGDAEIPWFAMELVDGAMPVTRFADARGMSLARRVELMAEVADGLHHGHLQEVVHRDIKPSNVLVGKDGRPKIIDFGLARSVFVPRRDVGEASSPLGTLAYMSPEQARGPEDVDVRSDVFSLGALAFEVLTRRRFRDLTGLDFEESVERIARDDAGEPRAAHLPADLAAVLARATAARPEDRYDSAAALAADLRAFNERRPVQAVPQTAGYLLRRFASRNPLVVGALALVLVSLTAGLVAVALGLRASREAQRDAEWGLDFFQSWLADVNPTEGDSGGLEFGEALLLASERLEEAPPPEALRAELHLSLGESLQDAGRPREAEQLLRQALELHRVRYGEDDRRTLDAMIELSYALLTLQYFDEVEELTSAAEAAYLRLDGGESADSLRAALPRGRALSEAGRFDEAIAYNEALLQRHVDHFGEDAPQTTTVRHNLAGDLLNTLQFEAAEEQFRISYERRLESLGAENPRTLNALKGLGNAIGNRGDLEQGSSILLDVVRGMGEVLGERHPRTLQAKQDAAAMLRRTGDVEQAIELSRDVLEAREELVGEVHPSTLSAKLNLATVLVSLARTRPEEEARGLRSEALALFVQIGERADALTPRRRSIVAANRGSLLGDEGRWLEAAEAFVAAIESRGFGEESGVPLYLRARTAHARAAAAGPLSGASLAEFERLREELRGKLGDGNYYVETLDRLAASLEAERLRR